MKKFLFLLLTLIFTFSVFSRDFKYTYNGQTLWYTVIDEDAKTCQTKNGDYGNAGNKVSGTLIIPATASDGTNNYSVTAIGDKAFYYCPDLISVSIPNSVTSIGESAFEWCYAFSSITIPNSVITIGGDAFSSTGLTSVSIPSSVTEIKWRIFESCSSLKSVTIPNSVKSIGVCAFSGCSSLSSISIPNSVTLIESSAFSGCSSLTSVIIPPSVTEIDRYTFKGCTNLKTVTIYNTVTDIGYDAFSDCINLTEIHCSAVKPPLCDGSFTNVPTSCKVNVPENSVEAYRSANEWRKFQILPEVPNVVFSLAETRGSIGRVVSIPVEMNNKIPVVAFQCDIHLPGGFRAATDIDGYLDLTLSDRKSRTHTIDGTELQDGVVRVIVTSSQNSAFSGAEGVLFNFGIEATTAVPGDYDLMIDDIIAVDANKQQLYLDPIVGKLKLSRFLGDVNGDEVVNVTDASFTIAHILQETPEGFFVENADLNCDGTVNVTDVNHIIDIALGRNVVPTRVRAAASADNGYFSLNNFSLEPGEEKEMPVHLSAPRRYGSFQTDIYLPKGMEFVSITEGGEEFYDVWLNPARATSSHTIASQVQADGALRVLSYSTRNALFRESSDDVLFYVRVRAKSTFSTNPEPVWFRGTIFNAGIDEFKTPDHSSDMNVKVEGGINDLEAEYEATYYNLQGVRISQPESGRLYIRLQGAKATKVVF